MTDAEVVQQFNEIFEKMHNVEVPNYPYTILVTKEPFHAMLEHFYIVINTRLITLSFKMHKNHNKDAFYEEFLRTNLDYAEFYKTRNEAKRAVSRNRKYYSQKKEKNSKTAFINGIRVVLAENIGGNYEIH